MMAQKKLHWLDRFIYFLNVVFAFLLLISYLLPFISPKFIPFISILNFGIPLLILINVLFCAYWILKLKKQVLLSAIALLLGLNHITSLYVFNEQTSENEVISNTSSFKLISYNVRHFNMHEWIPNTEVTPQIKDFLLKEQPDFIAFQDFEFRDDFDLKKIYPYQVQFKKEGNRYLRLSLFSKYPFLKQKNLDFSNTGNGAFFVDVKLPKDTLRIFNIHLESLKIKPDVKELQNEDRNQLISRVGHSFKKQAEQIELILPHLEASPFKNIVIGDFNNTAFSYIYRALKNNNLKDAFKEKGNGFGKTFDFDFIPIRIDHALVDNEIEVLNFKNYDIQLSDHYPISVEFKLP
ncbi:endonuclease/exonuclease/phosphatase family protein [Psychroflexus salis]|uniref:Endonuclease n=1 Tax=Psychroflexus salis TaxID=1526574 RepID=A0A917ECL9_9FLAO|nr:endonuclease/exonuclease/phosphatase family protein [Psychroflexus salis]GGE19567.1 endonuclease [Psychroflexus salis]